MAHQDTTRYEPSSTHAIADALSEKTAEYANKASEKIDSAIASAEQHAGAMVQSGREAGARVQEVAGNLKTAVDKSVRDQPMATLAIAAAAGFVMGAIWKS